MVSPENNEPDNTGYPKSNVSYVFPEIIQNIKEEQWWPY